MPEIIEKAPLTSLNIAEEQTAKLRSLFPEVFTYGGKIDFDKLKLTLGEAVDTGKERYGMNWPGKADCYKTIQQPSIATLVPDREGSVNFDTSENLFIEGDNLEVLKLLQKSYLGKVKMIYIDPPYNTGNDFIYPDNYSENLQTYLEYTGQIDSEGRKFSTNTETDGRFHSKWINMMYPRLFLARNLLTDAGVIFISIDHNEVANLKKICEEIFGEENFVGQLAVINNLKGRNDKKNIAPAHEYLIVFQKSNFNSLGLPLTDEQLKAFKYIDERGEKYGLRDLRKRGNGDKREDRPNMFFPIYYSQKTRSLSLTKQDGDIEIFPKKGDLSDGRWRWGIEKVSENLNILEAKYSKKKDRWDIDYRVYLNQNLSVNDEENDDDLESMTYEDIVFDAEDEEEEELLFTRTSKSKSFWMGGEISSDVGKRQFKKLFENKADFSYPKSVEFLKRCLSMGLAKDELVLDFFAGSAAIAQAVFEMNAKDGGKRKFICVQLPEPLEETSARTKEDRAIIAKNIKFLSDIGKSPNLVEISKERIIRTITFLSSRNGRSAEKVSPELFKTHEELLATEIDLGFKSFKLASSNFMLWDSTVEKTAEAVQAQLYSHIDHISAEAEQEAILYELLLKSGFALTIPVQEVELEGKKVFSIADGAMLICLEKNLTPELIKAIGEQAPQRVICLDEGFGNNDQLKTNAVQIMKSKKVLKFQTV